MVTQSRLLNLPPELRENIYKCIIPTHVTVTRSGFVPHALARTCRQLRADYLPLSRTTDKAQASTITLISHEINEERTCSLIPDRIDLTRLAGLNLKFYIEEPTSFDLTCMTRLLERCGVGGYQYRFERSYTLWLTVSKQSVHFQRTIHVNGGVWYSRDLLNYLRNDEEDVCAAVAEARGFNRLVRDEAVTRDEYREAVSAHVDCFKTMIGLRKVKEISWTDAATKV